MSLAEVLYRPEDPVGVAVRFAGPKRRLHLRDRLLEVALPVLDLRDEGQRDRRRLQANGLLSVVEGAPGLFERGVPTLAIVERDRVVEADASEVVGGQAVRLGDADRLLDPDEIAAPRPRHPEAHVRERSEKDVPFHHADGIADPFRCPESAAEERRRPPDVERPEGELRAVNQASDVPCVVGIVPRGKDRVEGGDALLVEFRPEKERTDREGQSLRHLGVGTLQMGDRPEEILPLRLSPIACRAGDLAPGIGGEGKRPEEEVPNVRLGMTQVAASAAGGPFEDREEGQGEGEPAPLRPGDLSLEQGGVVRPEGVAEHGASALGGPAAGEVDQGDRRVGLTGRERLEPRGGEIPGTRAGVFGRGDPNVAEVDALLRRDLREGEEALDKVGRRAAPDTFEGGDGEAATLGDLGQRPALTGEPRFPETPTQKGGVRPSFASLHRF